MDYKPTTIFATTFAPERRRLPFATPWIPFELGVTLWSPFNRKYYLPKPWFRICLQLFSNFCSKNFKFSFLPRKARHPQGFSGDPASPGLPAGNCRQQRKSEENTEIRNIEHKSAELLRSKPEKFRRLGSMFTDFCIAC